MGLCGFGVGVFLSWMRERVSGVSPGWLLDILPRGMWSKDLSKDPLSFGTGGGSREGLERLFCCCGVGRPVGLPIVCEVAWT